MSVPEVADPLTGFRKIFGRPGLPDFYKVLANIADDFTFQFLQS
jgi:hypothetical protein